MNASSSARRVSNARYGTHSISTHSPYRLGPVNTYLSASKMSTKWMKPMNITSSFSNRENIRR